MQQHIHIKTHNGHHATAWVDHDGKVHHDGSILAANAVEEMRKHAHRDGKVLEGQPLLDAVVERYDRATMAHAYHCQEHHEH